MVACCMYKWKLNLREFGFKSHIDFEFLRRCGIEFSHIDSYAIVRIIAMMPEPMRNLPDEIRLSIYNSLNVIAENTDSTTQNIFITIAGHIRFNQPSEMVVKDIYNLQDDPDMVYINKFSQEVFNIMTTASKITDNGNTYNYNPYNIMNNDNPNKFVFNNNIVRFDVSVDIRNVEKIINYNNNNWKVKYSVSMNKDETYNHCIEVSDFNDPDNKTTVNVKTDSHFIKALDERIKTAINELENNLWTIDRFEKWSGDLSG